jgi:hypothetical protein
VSAGNHVSGAAKARGAAVPALEVVSGSISRDASAFRASRKIAPTPPRKAGPCAVGWSRCRPTRTAAAGPSAAPPGAGRTRVAGGHGRC